uniref:hypothetical protein n=1 Tax=Micromonospora acroterricola TaxID=2202421 RepID=UPI00191BE023|nr:hypothetical protein [Micromonospora acroterricola]
MSRSSTPGSPAGRPAVPTGHRAQSFDYIDSEDEVALDPALVTSPGHGAVGVFQAPRPVSRRTPPAEPSAVSAGENADIDSPFLDLFGASRPGTTRAVPATREQPAIPQQPPAAEPSRPARHAPQRAPELEPPWTADESTGGGRPAEPRRAVGNPAGESRVPHQAGDRLPLLRPPAPPNGRPARRRRVGSGVR